MIDATHRKAHRTAASLRKKGRAIAASAAPGAGWAHQGRVEGETPRRLRRPGMPVALLLIEGQASDHRGAALLLHKLPTARERIATHG